MEIPKDAKMEEEWKKKLKEDLTKIMELKDPAQKTNARLHRVFNEIVKKNPKDNIVTSSLSVYLCFAIIAEALSGKSLVEMQAIFGYLEGKVLDEEQHKSLKGLLDDTNTDIVIKIFNAIYTNKNIKIKPEYTKQIEEKYKAHAESLDFSLKETVDTINQEINDATDGLVTKAIKNIAPSAFAIIANSIYFKGDWDHKFNKDSNVEMDFTKADKSKKKVEFLTHSQTSAFIKLDGKTSYLAMKYKNHNVKFVIEMPKDGILTSSDSKEVLEAALGKESTCAVFVPKFTSQFSLDMIPILKEVGIAKVFAASKEFTKMTEHQMCITSVHSSACITVDEEGTVASMFTIVVEEGETSSGVQIPTFSADRPFFFHIVDCKNKFILFSGALQDPQYDGDDDA